jgi:hypothetical protein
MPIQARRADKARVLVRPPGGRKPGAPVRLSSPPQAIYIILVDQAPTPRPAPPAWLDILEEAEADIAAGHVQEIDIDALCREIDAEADALEAEQRAAGPKSAA